jgi:hypothetical protein
MQRALVKAFFGLFMSGIRFYHQLPGLFWLSSTAITQGMPESLHLKKGQTECMGSAVRVTGLFDFVKYSQKSLGELLGNWFTRVLHIATDNHSTTAHINEAQ